MTNGNCVAIFSRLILMNDIGMCSQWQKVYVFPNFKEKIQIQRTKTLSPFFDILTALCHSKLHFCVPNFKNVHMSEM